MVNRINLAALFLIMVCSIGYSQVISSSRSRISVKVESTDTLSPEIILLSPATENNEVFNTSINKLKIIGEIRDSSPIKALLINSAPLSLSDKNVFSSEMLLNQGMNEFNLLAIDIHDNYSRLKLTVNYILNKPAIYVEEVEIKGDFYGLLIGVEHYGDPRFPNLDNPIKDVERLYRVLLSKYNFKKENIIVIRDASYKDIIKALDELSSSITVDDNLLIFYAGHGWWDADANIGYWLPADASQSSKEAWFRNSTLRDYIMEIKSKHTLLITDACFGGSIFKTRSVMMEAPKAISKLYELKSRKAMTSGTLTTVPDRSEFTHYLINCLENNEQEYLSSEQLFSSIRIPVINNSDVVPQYGEIMQVGDEGGDFIFISKK
jgi:hypothetical protein